MKFAHLSDCHIGSWRDAKLREITTEVFCRVMDHCLAERVDFVLISGDLFNTSLPSLDLLKTVVGKLKEVKDSGIPVYGIAGSHDYSPSGKTMLDVLEEAGLFLNVARGEEAEGKLRLKFSMDPRTGAKITGLVGRKGGLEKDYYHHIDRESLEGETGYKIFLFHTAITELKPEHLAEMEAQPISLLPRGFDYYAGGHVHIVKHVSLEGYRNVVYPGPLFPNSFSELEKLDCGGFYLVDVDGKVERVSYIPVVVHPITNILVESDYWTPQQITDELVRQCSRSFENAIVTVRLQGVLREGSLADIDFKRVIDLCVSHGAYVVMKNTAKLSPREVTEFKVGIERVDDIETQVIAEHVGQNNEYSTDAQKRLALSLLTALSAEKDEGERVIDFEEKVSADAQNVVSTILKSDATIPRAS